MVWSGSAAHPSNCTRLWCSKYPRNTRKIFVGKLKCVSPGPYHGETDSLESFRQVQNKSNCPLHSFLRLPSNPSISINISHIVCWASPFRPSVAPQSTRYFWCHFATSGGSRASHQRINVGMNAIGLSLVTFFGIKKNIVVQACCGNFPLCSTFSWTLRFLPSFLLSNPGELWSGSRHIPLLSLPLTILTLFPIHTRLALAALPLISSIPHVFQGMSSKISTSSLHCQCFCPFFPLCSQRSNSRAFSSSFFGICSPPLHAVGFVILCKSPALPPYSQSYASPFVDASPPSFSLHLPFHFL